MRSILCGILIAAMTTRAVEGGPPMSEVARGNNQFALDLHSQLSKQPGNLFYSPTSLSLALAMTYAGARGETAAEMAKVLRLSAGDQVHTSLAGLQKSMTETSAGDGCRLSLANRLWGQQGYHFLADFLAITRDFYGAELAEVDFVRDPEQARQRINDWVLQRTEGKISDLIPQGVLNDLTRLVLTNAIYFKGAWSKPFSKSATREHQFHVTSDKTTQASFMSKQDDFKLWAGEGLKVLELPYGKGQLTAAVILPDATDGLTELESKLSAEKLERWLSGLRSRKVQVLLPRFKLTSQFSLRDVLTAMGMRLAFQMGKADFSGISSQEPLYISAVIHKAFVDVNEEGTEAAAATGVVVAARAAMVLNEPIVFRADHPFLFLIRDLRTGSIVFMGRVVNPQS
jgi:serpin B